MNETAEVFEMPDIGQTPAEEGLLPRLAMQLTPDDILIARPPREFLLRDAETQAGVFVTGKLGLIAGDGGQGKTTALIQLAVAVATGTSWLGWSATPGRVLCISARKMQMRSFAASTTPCRWG